MKKLIIAVFLFASVIVLIPAQGSDPFAGSRWQGRVSYRDAENRLRNDLYELILVKNGTCIVTLTTSEKRKELFQDGDGLWSFDREGSIFRLDCEFYDVTIAHIPYINWKSVYNMDEKGSTFSLLIKPYPGAPSSVSVRFNRVDD